MLSTNLSIAPPIMAHRGASALAPENTLAAFRKVKELGLKWVEFDVMLTACGEVVVIHDETLNRTTAGFGRVRDYTYAQLKTLDAGSWFHSTFSAEKIPTLIEVIQVLQECDLSANIEIKSIPGEVQKTVERVLEITQEKWSATTFPPLFSSFSLEILQILRKNSPTSLLGFLMDEWQADWQSACDFLECVTVNVNHKCLTESRVKEIKATERLLLSYTVNKIDQAKKLFAWGVDAIFSDCPEQMALFFNSN